MVCDDLLSKCGVWVAHNKEEGVVSLLTACSEEDCHERSGCSAAVRLSRPLTMQFRVRSSQSLAAAFEAMLVEGSDAERARQTAADVAIECGDGVKLYAHRCVLMARFNKLEARCVQARTILTLGDTIVAVLPWAVAVEASSAAVGVALAYAYTGDVSKLEATALRECREMVPESPSELLDLIDHALLRMDAPPRAGTDSVSFSSSPSPSDIDDGEVPNTVALDLAEPDNLKALLSAVNLLP